MQPWQAAVISLVSVFVSCDVTVWNRTKSKCDPLLSLGAKYASHFVFDFVFAYPSNPFS